MTDKPSTALFERLIHLKAFDLLRELLDNASHYGDLKVFYAWSHYVFCGIAGVKEPDEETLDFLACLLKKAAYTDNLLGKDDLFRFWINHGAHPSIIRCMPEAGCNPDYVDDQGQTLFHFMAVSNSLSTDYAIAYIHLFCRYRLDVDQKDLKGSTPLILAIHARNVSVMSAFLSYGASIHVRDSTGRDAFYYSVVQERSLDMYMYLSSFVEPSFNLLDRYGFSILDYFVMGVNEPSDFPLLEQMIIDGADLWRESSFSKEHVSPIDVLLGKDCKMISRLLKRVNVNTQDFRGDTMLHKLCSAELSKGNDLDQVLLLKVKLLVRKGANPGIVNHQNKTAVDLALNDPKKALVVEFLRRNSVSLASKFFLRDGWRN